jgi:hypothetical protein
MTALETRKKKACVRIKCKTSNSNMTSFFEERDTIYQFLPAHVKTQNTFWLP